MTAAIVEFPKTKSDVLKQLLATAMKLEASEESDACISIQAKSSALYSETTRRKHVWSWRSARRSITSVTMMPRRPLDGHRRHPLPRL